MDPNTGFEGNELRDILKRRFCQSRGDLKMATYPTSKFIAAIKRKVFVPDI